MELTERAVGCPRAIYRDGTGLEREGMAAEGHQSWLRSINSH